MDPRLIIDVRGDGSTLDLSAGVQVDPRITSGQR